MKSKKGNNESSKDTESQSSVDEQAKNILKHNKTSNDKNTPLNKNNKKNKTITFNVDTDLESPTQNNVQSRLRPPLTSTDFRPLTSTGLRPLTSTGLRPTVPFSLNHDEFGIHPVKLNFNKELNLDNNTNKAAESVIENSIINS